MKDNCLGIRISYLLANNSEWKVIQMTPEDYFDLDEDEQAETDSAPLFNYAIDYIKEDNDKVIGTNIEIIDKSSNKKRIINTSYWNKQENRITQRIDSGFDFYDNEITVLTKIEDQPPVFEILRVMMRDKMMIPVYHGFITDKEDGSQSEKRIL